MPLLIRLLVTSIWSVVILTLQSSGLVTDFHASSKPIIEETAVTWSAEDLKKPPNIIVVLSESFWDETQMKQLKFSRDPIPFFHKLQEQYTHGDLLSPMFGGGTANVEMEVLTGHSMRFFPEGATPYEDNFKQPTASLASLLSAQGYHTTAISPYHGWFFNSFEVYKHLGFSRFISLEYFNPDEYVGPYIGDHAVAKRIIEESEKSPGADFIFSNTMENHYHYWPNKFKRNTIDIKGDLSREAIGIAETYAQGLTGADQMLQELVSHFSRVKEPTVIVFFGDHLPSLEKYFVYNEAKFISGEDDPDFQKKMHTVPFLIWNNYLPKNGGEELHLSPSFLSPYVLHLAQRPGSAYTDYLFELSQKMPVVPPEGLYDEMNIDVHLVQDYEQRQNAILDAEKQAAADGPPDTVPFTLGYGEPFIDQVSPEYLPVGGETFGKTNLTVKGGRFGIGSTIFVNGELLKTTWENEHTLSAAIPKEWIAQPGMLELKVQIVDSKGHLLASSPSVSVPVRDNK